MELGPNYVPLALKTLLQAVARERVEERFCASYWPSQRLRVSKCSGSVDTNFHYQVNWIFYDLPKGVGRGEAESLF